MILSLQEKNRLIERLPEIELSYDTILHRKVHADVFVVIPKGKKALLWFTYWKGQNVCFTMTLNERGNICDVANYPVCFDSELSLSTLLYGTVFEVNGLKHFTCENIYYYKGYFTGHYNFGKKLSMFRELFTYYIKQVAYTTSFLIIGLPVMTKDFQDAINSVAELPYQAYGIQMYYLYSRAYKNNVDKVLDKTNTSEGIYLIKQATLIEAVFLVKATLQNDIYHLYCGGNAPRPPCDKFGEGVSTASHPVSNKFEGGVSISNGGSGQVQPVGNDPFGIAMIPSLKSSIMMNSLFRTIKENANLDLLEESDDEAEFENSSESKFVDLDKSYIMKCVFLKRFRKWQPVEVIRDNGKNKINIITHKEALLLEKRGKPL